MASISIMKRLVICLLCSIILCPVISAQKIIKNEVDKFTKSEIVETSTETLYVSNYMGTGYDYKFDFQIRRVNGEYAMPAKILMTDIVKYTEEDGVTFLLSNGDTVTLLTNYTGVGGEAFGNGYWFSTSFNLTKSDVEKLKANSITDVRVTYMGGHYDYTLKQKKQGLIKTMLELFK